MRPIEMNMGEGALGTKLTRGLRDPSTMRGAAAMDVFGSFESLVIDWETHIEQVPAALVIARISLVVFGTVSCIMGF